MNFLKKNSAKRVSFKICGAVLLVAALAGLAWHYVPMHYARFYLTRGALHTRGKLMELWAKDQGDGEANEEA